MKFKIGDMVKGINSDIEGCEGKIVSDDGLGFGIKLTKIGNENWHGKSIWQVGKVVNRPTYWIGSLQLIPTTKTWENLEAGDILIDGAENETKVLAVINSVFLRSKRSTHDEAASWYTKEEAQKEGWTIKQPEQPKEVLELTLKDVAQKFGVEEVKIKDNK